MRAVKKGVTTVAGSDDCIDFQTAYAVPSKRTLIGYAESCMTITEARKAATINGARQLNRSRETGIFKAGFLTDIIAVDGHLDKDINAIMNVHFVIKDGEVFVSK